MNYVCEKEASTLGYFLDVPTDGGFVGTPCEDPMLSTGAL